MPSFLKLHYTKPDGAVIGVLVNLSEVWRFEPDAKGGSVAIFGMGDHDYFGFDESIMEIEAILSSIGQMPHDPREPRDGDIAF